MTGPGARAPVEYPGIRDSDGYVTYARGMPRFSVGAHLDLTFEIFMLQRVTYIAI
jgi:hypothetical protein